MSQLTFFLLAVVAAGLGSIFKKDKSLFIELQNSEKVKKEAEHNHAKRLRGRT